jgi:hypothetical protein
LTSLFGLLAGAILFLPSILGIIKPPFIWNPLLYTFWVVGVLSLVCLGLAIYFLRFSKSKTYPDRISGIGFWLALAALASLVIYVAANGFEERSRPPYVQSVKISSPNPRPGEVVELSADVIDESKNSSDFIWRIGGKEVARGRVAYWAVPKEAGKYPLVLCVEAGSRKPAQNVSLNVLVSERGISMSKAIELINASIMQGLGKVQEKDRAKFNQIYVAYDANRLPLLVAEHFAPDDAEVYFQVIPRAFESAVLVLPDAELQDFLSGLKLPPCKDYPGLWPFCKKS